MKAVITIVGQDRVGIVAMVSGVLAVRNVNILSINQNILNGFFNMVIIADVTNSNIDLASLQKELKEKGSAMGLDIKAQHEDIFRSMHRI
jgi:ACT domain-containing protein